MAQSVDDILGPGTVDDILGPPADQASASGDTSPAQTVGGGVQAAASGINAGIADLAGLPVDTARRALEIGKAAIGSAYGAATSSTTTPAGETPTADGSATRTTHGLYHYIDPNTGADTFSKNPTPGGCKALHPCQREHS